MGENHIELTAYAQTLGVELDSWQDGKPVLAVDCKDDICGNPGMVHGGAVSAVLEMAAIATLDADLRARQSPGKLTKLNSTIEFLRAAGQGRTYASAEIIRAGRRLANVLATIWQDSSEKPVAKAIVNITIAPAGN